MNVRDDLYQSIPRRSETPFRQERRVSGVSSPSSVSVVERLPSSSHRASGGVRSVGREGGVGGVFAVLVRGCASLVVVVRGGGWEGSRGGGLREFGGSLFVETCERERRWKKRKLEVSKRSKEGRDEI